MNRRNQPLTLPIILCFVASGGLSSCSNERHTQAAAPETVSNVSVIVAQTTRAPDWLEAVGTGRAAQTSQAGSQMMGDIAQIRAHEDDRVQSGHVHPRFH